MPDARPIDWVGRPCPKCAYVRTSVDVNPAWQCPRCDIAYAKFVASAAPIGRNLVAHGREMAVEARSDSSLLMLVAVNLLVLGIAHHMHMSLPSLMFVYLIQSLIIGAFHVVRILMLDEGRGAKLQVALFFCGHYGFFHLIYFTFIGVASMRQPLADPAAFGLCALAFAINHAFSLRHNLAKDAAGSPDIGTVMLVPYVRIIPMHLTIASGLVFAPGASGLLLFGLLKTGADALMHVVDHHVMAKKALPPVS
jgi:hypothetical protein